MTVPELSTPRSGYGGRGYRIPDRDRPYPGVTTVLKVVAKDGLHQWIADQVAAFAVANIQYLMSVSEEAGWGFLRWYWSRSPELVGSELRLHHEGVRDDSAELGTNIHEWSEAQIDGTYDAPELQSLEAEVMSEVMLEWLSQHRIESIESEFTVVNDAFGYAGTADALWQITCLHDPVGRVHPETGKLADHWCLGWEPGPFLTLVDLKTSRHTWPEHGMQLAALCNAPLMMRKVFSDYQGAMKFEGTRKGQKFTSWWIEEPNPGHLPVVQRAALLHIRPYDLDTKGATIEPFVRLIDKTDDLDLYWSGFQGALSLATMNKQIKERAKARGTED